MAAPYDLLITVLNAANIRLLDAYRTPSDAQPGQVGGEILDPSQIFTQQICNSAWRRMQEFLASLGFRRLENEVLITGLPTVATTDPGVMCSLGWAGYFNGSTTNPSFVLPQDLISPARLWERQVATPATEFIPMEYTLNGLTDQPKLGRNFQWEWREDQIFFPGSTVAMDLRIRYFAYLADFATVGGTNYTQQPVPISRCLDAFAWYIVSETANARGDIDGAPIDAKAEAAATKLAQREASTAEKRQEWSIPDIPPQAGNTPFDTCSTILNVCKVRLNAASKAAGDILTVTQPWTQQYFNNAWRRCQEYLGNLGYTVLKESIVITGLGPSVSLDPAIEVSISWSGYFNGSVLSASPALPQNLMFPLRLEERINGQNAVFGQMECILDGLPTLAQQSLNRMWEWRANTIYMPGATQTTDLRILYAKYLPDFVETAGVPWYLQQVQVPRISDTLSLFICAEVANARPDLELDPGMFEELAEDAAKKVFNRDVRMKQRVNARRRSLSGRLEYGQWYPGNTYA